VRKTRQLCFIVKHNININIFYVVAMNFFAFALTQKYLLSKRKQINKKMLIAKRNSNQKIKA